MNRKADRELDAAWAELNLRTTCEAAVDRAILLQGMTPILELEKRFAVRMTREASARLAAVRARVL
jgi:hypothetical protein